MAKLNLSENWMLNGSSKAELFEALKMLDERTVQTAINLRDLQVITITERNEDSATGYISSKVNGLKKVRLNLSNIPVEDRENITFVVVPTDDGKNKVYPISSWGIRDLADRSDTLCKATKNESFERNAFMVENFTDKNIKLILHQNDDGNLKVFGIKGREYKYVPQIEVAKAMENLLEQEMGECKIPSWSVTHEVTEALFEFPEKGDEVTAMYPEFAGKGYTPVIYFTTSDVGKSTISLKAGVKIDNTFLPIPKGIVDIEHSKCFNMKRLEKNIEKKIFSEYTSVPELLVKLIGIEVNVPSVLDAIFDKIDNHGIKKSLTAAKELALVELPSKATAYDVVMELISLPDRLLLTYRDGRTANLPDSSKDKLKDIFSNILYYDFEQEEPEIILGGE